MDFEAKIETAEKENLDLKKRVEMKQECENERLRSQFFDQAEVKFNLTKENLMKSIQSVNQDTDELIKSLAYKCAGVLILVYMLIKF